MPDGWIGGREDGATTSRTAAATGSVDGIWSTSTYQT